MSKRKARDATEEMGAAVDSCKAQRSADVDTDERLEAHMLSLCQQRGTEKTCWPSESARAIYTVDKWRSQMDHVRRVAVKLARQGRIAIEQHKARLDHDAWDAGGRKGIIRLRYLGSWAMSVRCRMKGGGATRRGLPQVPRPGESDSHRSTQPLSTEGSLSALGPARAYFQLRHDALVSFDYWSIYHSIARGQRWW